MLQAIKHGNTDPFTVRPGSIRCRACAGNGLGQTLVGSRVIKVQAGCFNLAP
jgi:hypothetical protein